MAKARSIFGEELKLLMLKACISPIVLSRKSGFPLSTVKRAMAGEVMSQVVQAGLEQACKEEIDVNAKANRR